MQTAARRAVNNKVVLGILRIWAEFDVMKKTHNGFGDFCLFIVHISEIQFQTCSHMQSQAVYMTESIRIE